jgi:hypothetical protein
MINNKMLLLFRVFFVPFLVVYSQELPRFTAPETFDYSVSHRQSVCDRQQAFHDGTVKLRDALIGLEVRPWLPLGSSFSDLDAITGAVSNDTELPGLIIDILDEVARRGEFTWRNSFGVSYADDVAQKGKTFDDVLYWALDTYDMAAAVFIRTFARINQGAVFPEGFVDSSIIMVGKQTNESKLNLWSFLEPFSWQVWLMILGTFIVSGIIYLWMEWIDEDSDRQVLGHKPTEVIYFSALTFIGDNKFQPKTDFARLFITALSFFSLMVGSAYTANLASFLVVQNTPSLQVQTIGEAVQAGFRLCVVAGSAAEGLIVDAYPSAKLFRVDPSEQGEAGVFHGVVRGDCKIAVTSVSKWDFFKGNSAFNPDCQLDWVGRVFKFIPGGLVMHSDSGTFCTSLIRDVFNLHLLEMEEDGLTASLVEKYEKATSDQTCDSGSGEGYVEVDDSSRQLGLQDMGGLFIVFYGLVLITVIMALAKWILARKEKTGVSNDVSAGNQETAPGSDNPDGENRPEVAASASEDALLVQLAILQRELDETMRQATKSRRSPPERKSVYTPV